MRLAPPAGVRADTQNTALPTVSGRHMKAWLVLLALFALPIAGHAENFLYRMDHRAPDVIFSTGFVPAGDNANLFRHVTGETCYRGERTSGFVATTSSLQFALDWGSEFARRGHRFFVYRIRQTDQFHSTTTSLMHAFASTGNSPYHQAARTFVDQGEWAARGAIPRDTIVDAVEYISQGRGAAPDRVTSHVNLNYIAGPSIVATEPFIWRYREDQPATPDSPDACSSSCFSFLLSPDRGRRQASRDVIGNVLACRRRMADRLAVLIRLFDKKPVDYEWREDP